MNRKRYLQAINPGSHYRLASVRRAERERGARENDGAGGQNRPRGGQNRPRRARSARNPRSFRRSQCEPLKNTPAAAAEERVSNGGDTLCSKIDSVYLLALVAAWNVRESSDPPGRFGCRQVCDQLYINLNEASLFNCIICVF